MTALAPIPNGTTGALPIVAVDAPTLRPVREPVPFWDGPPHGVAQLAATIAAVAVAWFAAALLLQGWAWAGLPLAVLAVAILAGAFLPDVLVYRWDRQAAEQDADDTEQGAA